MLIFTKKPDSFFEGSLNVFVGFFILFPEYLIELDVHFDILHLDHLAMQ